MDSKSAIYVTHMGYIKIELVKGAPFTNTEKFQIDLQLPTLTGLRPESTLCAQVYTAACVQIWKRELLTTQ